MGPFGFVEARTRIHKTSTTAERKAMYMPYVAPIQGVGDGYWGLDWKAVLEELQLMDPKRRPFRPSGCSIHNKLCISLIRPSYQRYISQYQ